jgi:hypothetical protein
MEAANVQGQIDEERAEEAQEEAVGWSGWRSAGASRLSGSSLQLPPRGTTDVETPPASGLNRCRVIVTSLHHRESISTMN